ncbi:MAG: S8 family serine peptidase, partial [Pleurocapsa sp. SU_196_0]|nr:S8 family serine peptidase [Pleurocapsa sp. SU_196_0]
MDAAHNVATNLGQGVKVAVIDTGLDVQHPMFQGALVPASDMWDFVGNDADPQEEGVLGTGGFGHGTAVAGIVLQVAPAAKIMPLRVLGPDGSGDVTHLAAAIDWAVAKGARVINLSLGSDDMSPAVEASLQAATAQGALVVSSSGNANTTNISYPASHAHLDNTPTGSGWRRLSVTSIDATFNKSAFANYGKRLGNRRAR